MKKLHLPWWFVDIHPIEVEKAIGHLKFNKSPGPDGIMSEHLKYGGLALAIYLIKRCLYYVPETFFSPQRVSEILHCTNS